jgi:hypothetical protein
VARSVSPEGHALSMGRRSFLRGSVAAPLAAYRETGSAGCESLARGGGGITAGVAEQARVDAGVGCSARGTMPDRGSRSQPENWWKRAWTDNWAKAPFSRRGINHGCMFVADSEIELYRRRVGSYPDAQGALTIARGVPPDSWDRIVGGPCADGLGADRSGTLLDWAGAGCTGHAMRTPGCFIVPHGPTVPYGIAWADFEKVADGTLSVGGVNVRDMYRLMGERIRAMCEGARKDIAEVVMRPNHEGMNQDTALRFALTNGSRQLYLVGAANGRTTSQITETYNAAMAQWARGLWEGAGYRIPIALSPAMAREPSAVPEVSYSAWMSGSAAGIYDLVCFSFHPRARFMPDDAAMNDVVTSATVPGLWTPAKALAAARATAAEERRVVKACSLEVSCRFEERYLDDDLSRYAGVVQIFYNYMYQNKGDVAFINAHNVRSFDPDWAVGKVGGDANLDHWRKYVSVFKALHGPPTS